MKTFLRCMILFSFLSGSAVLGARQKAVGKITRIPGGKVVAEAGDRVTVVLKKKTRLAVGAKLAAYKVRPDLLDESVAEEEGQIEDIVATLEVVKVLTRKKIVA